MPQLSTIRSLMAVSGLTLAASSAALAQAPEGDQPPAFEGGTVFAFEHVELSNFLTDERDEGLLRALRMIPDRLRELPAESDGEFSIEAAATLKTIVNALTRPGRIAVVYDQTPTGGFFGYGLLISVQTQAREEAQDLQKQVRAALKEANPDLQFSPSERFKGMSDLQLPVGLLSFGPREAADGWRYEVVLGTVPNPDDATGVLQEIPEGWTPLARAYFNMRGLAPAMEMVQTMAGDGQDLPPQVASVERLLSQDLITTYIAGLTNDAMVTRTVVHDARDNADLLMVGTRPLAPADLRIIPIDATMAYIRRLNEGWAASFVDSLSSMHPEAEEGFEEFNQETGVDLRKFAASIGDRVCFYTSELTGGGGLGSMVAMVSIADQEGLTQSLTGLFEFANEQARQQEGPAYVRIAKWDDGETTLYSLRFPGIPVPLEVTLGITDQWLVMAPLPQSVVAASRHIAGESPGLVPSAKTAGFVPHDAPLVEFSYGDTGKLLASGYPLLSMLGSGVANMVRSPGELDREPGMVVPLYSELVSGVRPVIKTTVWDGDDLVSESASPRSMVVNIGALLGTVAKFLPLAAAGVAAAEAEEFSAVDAGTSPLASLGVLAMPLPERLAARAALELLPPEDQPQYLRAVLAPVSDQAP